MMWGISMTVSECFLMITGQRNTVLAMATASALKKTSYTPFGSGGREALPGFNGEMCERLARHYSLGHGHRIFIPALMRFNRPDALSPFGAGGLNAYAYCGGDPINYQDPSGRMPKSISRGVNALAGGTVERILETPHRVAPLANRLPGRPKTSLAAVVGVGKISRPNGRGEISKVNKQFDELYAAGALKGKYTDFSHQPLWDDYAHAAHMNDIASNSGGVSDISKPTFYRDGAGYPSWVVDTSRLEVNYNYKRHYAARYANKESGRVLIQRARDLRRQYILDHYTHPIIGTDSVPQSVERGEGGAMWWTP
jgi:RHS repeat-associated protein